jgi:hypothetical protein
VEKTFHQPGGGVFSIKAPGTLGEVGILSALGIL